MKKTRKIWVYQCGIDAIILNRLGKSFKLAPTDQLIISKKLVMFICNVWTCDWKCCKTKTPIQENIVKSKRRLCFRCAWINFMQSILCQSESIRRTGTNSNLFSAIFMQAYAVAYWRGFVFSHSEGWGDATKLQPVLLHLDLSMSFSSSNFVYSKGNRYFRDDYYAWTSSLNILFV